MIRSAARLASLIALVGALTMATFGAAGAQELVPIEEDETSEDGTVSGDDPTTTGSAEGDEGQSFAAPLVVLSQYEVNVGDQIVVTAAGFRSSFVTVSVCGNAGRRGSQDCNQPASKSMELDADGSPTISDIVVGEPPMPCPCIVRVASSSNDEVAVADITLLGHPVADVVGGSSTLAEPLAASIVATRASEGVGGWLRSSLGGRTTYDVEVTLRNRTSERINGVLLEGSAGRNETDTWATFGIVPPAVIEPGQIWETVVQVELGAPVWGDAYWTLDVVAPNAPTVVVTDQTSHLPGLLIVLGLILIADVAILIIRFVLRRARKATWERGRAEAADDNDDEVEAPPERVEEVVLDLRGH